MRYAFLFSSSIIKNADIPSISGSRTSSGPSVKSVYASSTTRGCCQRPADEGQTRIGVGEAQAQPGMSMPHICTEAGAYRQDSDEHLNNSLKKFCLRSDPKHIGGHPLVR